jgi:predicted nucleotidyltransferase
MAEMPLPADQVEHLRRVCAGEPRVLAVFLFGSQINGYATPHSDVDLAILLEEEPTLEEWLGLEVKLCQALGRDDLDLLSLGRASISLRFRAISGRLLYERAPDRVSDFIQRTLVEYYDFQPVLETYQREFARSLEQDYGL